MASEETKPQKKGGMDGSMAVWKKEVCMNKSDEDIWESLVGSPDPRRYPQIIANDAREMGMKPK